MGSQFRYFLVGTDVAAFEARLLQAGDVVFLKSWPAFAGPEEVPPSATAEVEFRRLLLARRQDLAILTFTPIETQSYFHCDSEVEPIIEYDRCYIGKNYVRGGRLYRVNSYWNDAGIRDEKPRDFIKWAERLFRLAKSSLKHIGDGYYAGKQALELRDKGLPFVDIDIRERDIQERD